jgi:hypothetical protein
MKRKRNGSRIIFREKPPGQDSELQMQRKRLGRSRKIRRQMAMQD